MAAGDNWLLQDLVAQLPAEQAAAVRLGAAVRVHLDIGYDWTADVTAHVALGHETWSYPLGRHHPDEADGAASALGWDVRWLHHGAE